MSENIDNAEAGTPAVPEISPVEQQAIESGWVPKEQYHGEEHKWVDAGEFLRRGELFKKIENQSKELKDVKRALLEIKSLHSKVQDVEYQRALETLKAQKKAALEEGDADAVIAADERIDLVKQEQRELARQPQEQVNSEHPEFSEWKEKNSWYANQPHMKVYADEVGLQLAKSGLSPAQVLKKVEEKVREEFPNKFRNPNQAKTSAVEGGTQRGSNSSNTYQLTPEERKIMNTFVRTGVMTEAKYIEDLKKVKGVQ